MSFYTLTLDLAVIFSSSYSGMPLAQYSVIERSNLGSESELRSDPPVGQYSVVHSGSPQDETHFNTATQVCTRFLFVLQKMLSVCVHLLPFQITGNGVSVLGVSPPIPHHSPVLTNSKVVTVTSSSTSRISFLLGSGACQGESYDPSCPTT